MYLAILDRISNSVDKDKKTVLLPSLCTADNTGEAILEEEQKKDARKLTATFRASNLIIL